MLFKECTNSHIGHVVEIRCSILDMLQELNYLSEITKPSYYAIVITYPL